MVILGISSYHPDASAALIVDGKIVAAVDEERLNRIKHTPGFPEMAIKYCLSKAGLHLNSVDYISIANDIKANLMRKILFSIKTFPVKNWHAYLRDYLKQRISRQLNIIHDLAWRVGGDPKDIQKKIKRVEHHNAHGASSFYLSPFEEAAICTIDGSGDFITCSLARGYKNRMERLEQIYWPHSLGMLYFSVTQYLGFHEIGAEGKVMALASYGKPRYMDEFRKIVRLTENSFEMDMTYFTFHHPVLIDNWGDPSSPSFFIYRDWLSEKFYETFGPPRVPGSEYTQRHMDIAATLQAILEETVFHLLKRLHRVTGQENVCLAGGVALNCVMNGKITRCTPFKRMFIQPNAGDGGISLGSALYLYHHVLNGSRTVTLKCASLGTEYNDREIRDALERFKIRYNRYNDFYRRVAEHIADGRIVGWFQGRMEFGPRALGNRSILADPRRPEMKDILNSRVKHREYFRPFAPSVLEEEAGEFFEMDGFGSPFMLQAIEVKDEKKDKVPAIIHVDGTARVQTVDRESNPRFRRLIEEFKKLTGIPMVLNTSFNLKGEPIVCSPEDAIKSFLATQMDVLAIGDYIVEKDNL